MRQAQLNISSMRVGITKRPRSETDPIMTGIPEKGIQVEESKISQIPKEQETFLRNHQGTYQWLCYNK